VVLSLVIIVVIVSNVVLWSYEMNQLDWEKMNEDITITDVTRITNSSWFVTQSEYTVNIGSQISGTYADTQAVNGSYERFAEASTSAGSYNPSGYALGGSTSLMSGSVSDLTSDDDVYMTFRSYNSGNTTIQPITNMNFTSDATGWVYGESADTVATGAWDPNSGRTDPGCYNFTIVDNLATAFYSIDQFINYSFTVDTLPSQAIVYGSVRLTSDDDFLFRAEIRLVRPDNSVTTVWVGNTYSDNTAFDSGWINVTVDATSNFTLTGTYQLSLFTHSETDDLEAAATKVTLVHYWDDAGITLTVPIYTAEVEFTGSSNTEDWTQLNWTINSAWTIGSVNVTLQLYNYTLNDYPTSGNGYISYTSSTTANTDETKNQTITVNPTHFRNSTGYWKMKAKGVKVTDTQFDFKADWIEFKLGGGGDRLDMNGTFTVDLSTYPLDYIQTVEIQLRYRANDIGENWYLKAYNWTATAYSDSGFNNTSGHTPTTGWDTYAVNLTDKWRSYVSNSGTMYVKLQDNLADANQTTIDIDFLGVRVKIDGTRFTFKNEGSVTLHMVSLWINNSTLHQRYDMDIIVNSAETYSYIRADISLATGSYTVKIVTERGNKAVYSVEV
jgi:hypothetical protein